MSRKVVVEYTDPEVIAGMDEGWAEPITDPSEIDWPERQARAAIPFEVIDGRPVNPCQKTYVQRGRNRMQGWGENLAADAVVVGYQHGSSYLLMVERGDRLGWAIPGGHVDPGENPMDAAARELAEETGLVLPASAWQACGPVYVPDPRASDEAWVVTVPSYADLGPMGCLPRVRGGDDALRAEWVIADDFVQLASDLRDRFDGGRVFPAHIDLIRQVIAARPKYPYFVEYAVARGTDRWVESTVVDLPFQPTTADGVREFGFRLPHRRGFSIPELMTWVPLEEVTRGDRAGS